MNGADETHETAGTEGAGGADATGTGTTGDTYFERLAVLMRERGVPQTRVELLTRELAAYADEAGGEVAEEFGPVAELAEQLSEREATGLTDGSAAPGDGAETWVWTADAFKDVRLLDRFGGQGWEVERLDKLGRFVCRRDLEHPMRWEYRRETAGHVKRAENTARLGPDGWELCGVWGPFTYYKRPAAVHDGPAAALAAPPAPPRKRVYIGKWIYAWIAACALAAVAVAWWGVRTTDFTDPSTVAGAIVGLTVAGTAAWGLWRSALRKGASGGE
ncbi:hypothetical protein [Streptomyces winkii]|uniref:hypothetical protein n=1 Tax=Streptomyces winkii TaxID=3051178 RepID=UPI0028D655D1|nr:hypothetical protein [Streptomyces sp. DSM 40971]